MTRLFWGIIVFLGEKEGKSGKLEAHKDIVGGSGCVLIVWNPALIS